MMRRILMADDYKRFFVSVKRRVAIENFDEALEYAIDKTHVTFDRTKRRYENGKMVGYGKKVPAGRRKEIYESCKDSLRRNVRALVAGGIGTQADFDEWHRRACEEIMGIYAKDWELYFGQAQKWVNMTLKYMTMYQPGSFEGVYEFLHVPVDNVIAESTGYKGKGGAEWAWSRLDYAGYMEFQEFFRKKYEGEGLPMLDVEYKLWLENVK